MKVSRSLECCDLLTKYKVVSKMCDVHNYFHNMYYVSKASSLLAFQVIIRK